MSAVQTDLAGIVEDAAAHLYVLALRDIPQDLRDALDTLYHEVQTEAKKGLEGIIARL
jgi:hypothetical protein